MSLRKPPQQLWSDCCPSATAAPAPPSGQPLPPPLPCGGLPPQPLGVFRGAAVGLGLVHARFSLDSLLAIFWRNAAS
jgi:hypothetical protein